MPNPKTVMTDNPQLARFEIREVGKVESVRKFIVFAGGLAGIDRKFEIDRDRLLDLTFPVEDADHALDFQAFQENSVLLHAGQYTIKGTPSKSAGFQSIPRNRQSFPASAQSQ